MALYGERVSSACGSSKERRASSQYIHLAHAQAIHAHRGNQRVHYGGCAALMT